MLTIKNKADIATIFISGDIVDDDEGGLISSWKNGNSIGYEFPTKLREQLDAVKDKPLEIHINSCGGSVFAGTAMANFIANHKPKTTAIIDGIAASIASQIFFSADECKMPSNAYLMIHKPLMEILGNADDFQKAIEVLDTLQEGLESTYSRKARNGTTIEDIREMMNAETWFTGTSAATKFQIELLEPSKAINALGDIKELKARGIKQVPTALKFFPKQASMGATNRIDEVDRFIKESREMDIIAELKQKITAKREEVEKLQREGNITDALNEAQIINELCDKLKIEQALEDAKFEDFMQHKIQVTPSIMDDAKLANRAFNKLLFNRGTLTDDERAAYFNVTGSPGSPAQIESVPARGGYLVPQEQMKQLQEFRQDFVALKDYVSVVTTNTTSGRWATYSPQDLEFQTFAEMADIAESDVTFGEATYVIEDRGLVIPISNQLVADADVDIIDFIGRKLAEGAVKTENKEILKPLNTLITGDTDAGISAATTITTHKALNAALFQTLDASYLNAASIFTNQDGFVWLSNLDDSQNRPLLVPDVTAPNTYRYRGKEIVIVPNSTLPSTASGAKNYAPFFIGDMRSYITLFERQGLELATSSELYFRKYGTALRAIIRFGVVVTDPNAVTAVKVEL